MRRDVFSPRKKRKKNTSNRFRRRYYFPVIIARVISLDVAVEVPSQRYRFSFLKDLPVDSCNLLFHIKKKQKSLEISLVDQINTKLKGGLNKIAGPKNRKCLLQFSST